MTWMKSFISQTTWVFSWRCPVLVMFYPRQLREFIKRSITVKYRFWMSIYCFHSCHSLVLILLSHPSSNSMLVLILLSQAASMLLLISLTHSACLSCAITGWLNDSLDTYFVTTPVPSRWNKLHMIRIVNSVQMLGSLYCISMIFSSGLPKKNQRLFGSFGSTLFCAKNAMGRKNAVL